MTSRKSHSELVPHKWAKEIKAWADGHEIEVELYDSAVPTGTKWVAINVAFWNGRPGWDPKQNYRIAPTIRKYRIALFRTDGYTTQYNTNTADTCAQAVMFEDQVLFSHWLTDWVEYEVEA